MISRSQHVRSITSHISDPLFPYSGLLLGPWFSKNAPPQRQSLHPPELECQFCELIPDLLMQQKFWVQTQSLTKSFQLSQYMLSFENDPTRKHGPLLPLYDKHLRPRKVKWLPMSCRIQRRQDLSINVITTQFSLYSRCHTAHYVRNEAWIASSNIRQKHAEWVSEQ